jgi:hypothetical protein
MIVGSGLCFCAHAAERAVDSVDAYQENGRNVVAIALKSMPLSETATVAPQNLKSILIADAETGRALKLAAAESPTPNTILLTLAPGESVDSQKPLLIRFDKTPFGAKPENVVDLSAVTFKPNVPSGEAPQKPTIKAADGKNDALFYFDGEISHVRNGDVVGNYDLKFSYLTYEELFGTVVQHGPLYTLQGGDDPKADPDSMQLGWNLTIPVFIANGTPKLLSGLLWENTPQIESTRDFTYTNFVYSSIVRAVSRSWISRSGRRLYFRPYIGLDVGRTLSSNAAAAQDQVVLRPLAGSTLNAVWLKVRETSFSVSGDYVRRWPLHNEVLLSTGSSGIRTALAGTKPRDHVKAGIAIDFTKFASVSASYERGFLPPAFPFVDNKWTLSLVVKAKR